MFAKILQRVAALKKYIENYVIWVNVGILTCEMNDKIIPSISQWSLLLMNLDRTSYAVNQICHYFCIQSPVFLYPWVTAQNKWNYWQSQVLHWVNEADFNPQFLLLHWPNSLTFVCEWSEQTSQVLAELFLKHGINLHVCTAVRHIFLLSIQRQRKQWMLLFYFNHCN